MFSATREEVHGEHFHALHKWACAKVTSVISTRLKPLRLPEGDDSSTAETLHFFPPHSIFRSAQTENVTFHHNSKRKINLNQAPVIPFHFTYCPTRGWRRRTERTFVRSAPNVVLSKASVKIAQDLFFVFFVFFKECGCQNAMDLTQVNINLKKKCRQVTKVVPVEQ